jgi:hypothetical protein
MGYKEVLDSTFNPRTARHFPDGNLRELRMCNAVFVTKIRNDPAHTHHGPL